MGLQLGVLDLLDRVDQLLGEVELPPGDRKNKVRIQNARLALQETRRRIERVGQETKT